MTKDKPMPLEVIITQNLSRNFGDNVALAALNLSITQGEIVGLLGHNGAGKTTTLRLLCGVLAPSNGTATVFGLSPTTEGQQIRQRCGVLTETPSLEERLTARENLRYFANLYSVPVHRVQARINELLALLDLDKVADTRVGGFSKGMKQRLALARALLHEPELLLLDEPTSGLDPVAAKQVIDMIQNLSRKAGRTVLLCTHNLVEAQQVCDRVAVLEQGRLLALGTPTTLRRSLDTGLELEVSPDTLVKAMQCLSASQDLSVAVKPAAKLLIKKLEYDQIPELISQLVTAGVRLYRVTPQEASLEDVYFALHQKGINQETMHQEVSA